VVREEILGRDREAVAQFGTKGTCYLGKVVGYPAGRYEEVGSLFVDITSPHCILVLGKRGTGKSYTLGVLMEAFGLLEEDIRERIAVIAVDTMSVFHSLKKPNRNPLEVSELDRFGGLEPRGFEDMTRIFIPQLMLDRVEESGEQIQYDSILTLPLKDVDSTDWLTLFDLKPTEPAGTLLVHTIDRLKNSRQPFSFEDIRAEIDSHPSKEEPKSSLMALFRLVERLKIFDRDGVGYDEIAKAGHITILDISYLGRIGGFDLRNLLIALISRHLLRERTLQATLDMQREAGLVEASSRTANHPLVYMFIDEAHLFLPSGSQTHSTEPLVDWIKLGRHPGLSLVLATQEPSALHESAIKQADMIIAHNVTSADDIEALGKAKQSYMSRGRDIQTIVSTMEFRRGLAVIFDDKTRKMEMCRVRPRLSLHSGTDATALPKTFERSEVSPCSNGSPPS